MPYTGAVGSQSQRPVESHNTAGSFIPSIKDEK